MSTPVADTYVPVHTEEQLRAAWLVCRCTSWPPTFEEAMTDPLRVRMVDMVAAGLARKRPQAPVARSQDAPECRVHNGPCLDVRPSRRCANCIHRPPPPHFQPPAGYVDIKRRASGERDDD